MRHFPTWQLELALAKGNLAPSLSPKRTKKCSACPSQPERSSQHSCEKFQLVSYGALCESPKALAHIFVQRKSKSLQDLATTTNKHPKGPQSHQFFPRLIAIRVHVTCSPSLAETERGSEDSNRFAIAPNAVFRVFIQHLCAAIRMVDKPLKN